MGALVDILALGPGIRVIWRREASIRPRHRQLRRRRRRDEGGGAGVYLGERRGARLRVKRLQREMDAGQRLPQIAVSPGGGVDLRQIHTKRHCWSCR